MWRIASVVVGVSLILATLGIVMLASTSQLHALQQFNDPLFFVKRQVLAFALALALALLCSRVDYHWWNMLAVPLTLLAVVLLIGALLPGVGVTVKGSSRWIRFGPINFQPSEFGKLAVIMLMAWYIARRQRHVHELGQGLLLPLFLVGVVAGLIFIAPDFGTTALVVIVAMLMMYAGGTRFSYLLVTSALGFSAFVIAVIDRKSVV